MLAGKPACRAAVASPKIENASGGCQGGDGTSHALHGSFGGSGYCVRGGVVDAEMDILATPRIVVESVDISRIVEFAGYRSSI